MPPWQHRPDVDGLRAVGVRPESAFPGWWAAMPTVGTVVLLWGGSGGAAINRHV